MKINTLRFRISVLYVAVIGLILVLFQVFLYFSYVNSVSNEFDIQLKTKAEQIGGAVNTFRSMLGHKKQAFRLSAQKALNLSIEYPNYAFMMESPEKFWLGDAKRLGLDNDYLLIVDAQGDIVSHSKNVSKGLLTYFHKEGKLSLNRNKFYQIKVDKNILRIVAMPYFYAYKQGYIIVVGTSYEPVERILRRYIFFIVVSTVIFLVMASLIVRVFVISVLASVMKISKVARNISHDNLRERIELTHADEEIEHLRLSLNDMIVRLESSFAHIKEFSLEMAHEVKTPLAIISAKSQMAMEKDLTKEEYKEILTVVVKEARRTQKFVSDLLLLTKLDYRLIKMRFQPIDLAEFLREICQEMRMISSPKGVLIQEDIAPDGLLINGDKTHLERVFLNLIDNALKFILTEGCINIVAKAEGQKAVVWVSDNGPGIPSAELSKIFNKFYRVDGNDRSSIPGCGLGLSIVYSIIELHQGKITVQSELGKGTTFRIEFPRI